jgi:hypothetical protein
MKDQHDSKTLDLIPTPAKRGRPRTGRAMTAAEKQAAYRARKSALTVTVTINREDVNALQTLINAGVGQVDTVGADAIERIREAIHRAKTHG